MFSIESNMFNDEKVTKSNFPKMQENIPEISNPFEKISEILLNYLNETEDTEQKTVSEILETNLPTDVISSVFWTFSNIMREETQNKRMRLLGSALVSERPEFTPYFFLTMDKSEWEGMALRASDFIKHYKAFSQQINLAQYQFFNQSPEAFSRLFLAIYEGNFEDVTQIIGFHKIDPNAVLQLIFDIFDYNPTNGPMKILQKMPFERVLQFLLYRMKTKFTPGVAHVISYFYENEILNDANILFLYKERKESFEGVYKYFQEKAKLYCDQLRRPIIRLGDESKESSLSAAFKNARAEYQRAYQIWSNFPLFTMTKKLDDEHFLNAIRALVNYDPCQIDYIRERCLEIFKKHFPSFLESHKEAQEQQTNEDNEEEKHEKPIELVYELLVFLGGHISNNDIIFDLLEIPDLPPFIFSLFILPAIALSDTPWQISINVYEVLQKRFNYKQRYMIYKQFDKKQWQCIDQNFITSITKRKISYTLRRLSNQKGKEFSGRFSRIILRCPRLITRELLLFILEKTYDRNTKASLTGITSDLSPLSLDQLTWVFIASIEKKQIVSGNKNDSDWPSHVASFLADMFTDHYQDMDLNAFVQMIQIGITKMNTAYVCLFAKLLEKMCLVDYKGNLTPIQYDEHCVYNFASVQRKVSECDKDHDFVRSKHMKKALSQDNIGVKIISGLDVMRNTLPSSQFVSESLADRLDQIQFTIIESCDPIDINSLKLTPTLLISENSLSLSCAFHLSRASCTLEEAADLSPPNMPKSLFGMFWKLAPYVFHIPTNFIDQQKKKLNERLNQAEDTIKPTLVIASRMLTTNLTNQKEQQKKYRDMMVEVGTEEWFKNEEDYWIFVKNCIIPRTLFSELDAAYCALFINELFHWIPHINIEMMIKAILRVFHFILISSTMEESRSFGIFIGRLMDDLQYINEKKFLHDQFLNRICLVLDKSELMSRLNSIEVLSTVMDHFPEEENDVKKIKDRIDEMLATSGEKGLPENLTLKLKSFTTKLQKKIDNIKKEKEQEKEMKKKLEDEEKSKKRQPPPPIDRRPASSVSSKPRNPTPQKLDRRPPPRDPYDRRRDSPPPRRH